MAHDCVQCGATIVECDEHIREASEGCCAGCFSDDTHGLVESAEHNDIVVLHRLMAQMVIARGEHAKAIRAAQADIDGLIEDVALLRGRLAVADQIMRHQLMLEVMTEVRRVVLELPERVEIIERALPEIERRLGLKRRAELFVPKPPFVNADAR